MAERETVVRVVPAYSVGMDDIFVCLFRFSFPLVLSKGGYPGGMMEDISGGWMDEVVDVDDDGRTEREGTPASLMRWRGDLW